MHEPTVPPHRRCRDRSVARLLRHAMPALRRRALRAIGRARAGSAGLASRPPAGFAPLERVLRRAAVAPGGDTVVHRHLSVSALLRASFTLFGQRGASAPPAAAPMALGGVWRERLTLLQRERMAPSQAAPLALRAAAALLARVQRMPAAADRASAGPGTNAAAVRATASPAAARLPAVLLRTQPAVAPAVPPAVRDERQAPQPGVTRPVRAGSVATTTADAVVLAPRELSRVTDHVIRQLDRRIVSYAERTGRN